MRVNGNRRGLPEGAGDCDCQLARNFLEEEIGVEYDMRAFAWRSGLENIWHDMAFAIC